MIQKILFTSLIFAVLFPLYAADWPMWKYNSGHSAVSPEKLPESLHLQWKRELGTPSPAWPENQKKLRFDDSYEPVASENMIFVPSMRANKVSAYDSSDGKELWRFYTDGPVRLAPLIYKEKLFFGSDDGNLYCLNKNTGKLIFKKRLAPSDKKNIGNEKMISIWPVRGAPVLHDGKIYVSAGIWPFMGIFIYCINADTGKTVWCNSGSGSIFIKQQHNSPAFAGVAPQGYMTISGNILLVPGGRTVPAAYDRHTGKFLYYHLSSRQFGKASGGYGIAANEKYFFNGGNMYDSFKGKGLCRRVADVLTKDEIFSIKEDGFYSSDFSIKEKEMKGAPKKIIELENSGKLFLKAENTIYCGSTDQIFAYNLKDRPKKYNITWKPSWQAQISGIPWTMIAAGKKLFVVTKQGTLYCFGGKKVSPVNYPDSALPLLREQITRKKPVNEINTLLIQSIIRKLPNKKGYCLVLGINTQTWIKKLLHDTDFQIIVLEENPEKTCEFRKKLDASGLYGNRLNVVNGKISDFPPYFASLVLAERMPEDIAKTSKEIYRVLRPYGGAAYVQSNAAKQEDFRKAVTSLNLPGAKTKIWNDGLVRLKRTGSLPGSASWTHQYADSGNTIVSKDKLVKLPLGILWFGGASNKKILPRHGHGPTPQVVGGRIFIEGRNILRALDVYTGRLLWEKEIKDLGKFYDNTWHHPGANKIGSNYVSMQDAVYVITPKECLVLNPVNGNTIKKVTIPKENSGTQNWGYIAVNGKYLIAATTPIAIPLSDKKRTKTNFNTTSTDIIKQNADWYYLTGNKELDWNTQAFSMSKGWKKGKAGFGYGDDDDKTELKDMRGNANTVYIRKTFDIKNPSKISELKLMIRYDDGFIAYLNGKEIARASISSDGSKTQALLHEAGEDFDNFKIENFKTLLKKKGNVLAIEGHNTFAGSSDFSLDPYLLALVPSASLAMQQKKNEQKEVLTKAKNGSDKQNPPRSGVKTNFTSKANSFLDRQGVKVNVDYSSGSRNITVLDRHTGKIIWTKKARFNFRHNAIIAGNGTLFCIDSLSDAKFAFLKRRGYKPSTRPVLYALDLKTGKELWKTDKNIFGTWLGYSSDYNILIQAGSAYRDRASDEASKGLAAYNGSNGKLLWENNDNYPGPCMLHKNRILTQKLGYMLQTGARVMRKNLIDGKSTPWIFRRNYGCNTAIASEHLLTFRSAAAGYFDLDNSSGTGNLGGFKSGCTSSLIAADGVLNAPDYTKTCTCSYQNQSSLALIHSPDVDIWTFTNMQHDEKIKRIGINFGAPGDRFNKKTLWLEYPIVGGPSPHIPVSITPPAPNTFRHHSSLMKGNEMKWVAASGIKGVDKLIFKLPGIKNCDIRMYFTEPDILNSGERVFSININGENHIDNLDIMKESGERNNVLVKSLNNISIPNKKLEISFKSTSGEALISGIEIIAK